MTILKKILVLLLIISGIHFDSKAQCKYEYEENDVITGKSIFKTEYYKLSNKVSKNKTYIVKNIRAGFENDGVNESLLFEFNVKNSYGKMIIYRSTFDSLIMKFEDGTIETLVMKRAPTLIISGFVICKLSYELDESIKSAFRNNKIIEGIRITSSSFNIDIGDFEMQLFQKFNECWIEQ